MSLRALIMSNHNEVGLRSASLPAAGRCTAQPSAVPVLCRAATWPHSPTVFEEMPRSYVLRLSCLGMRLCRCRGTFAALLLISM